MTFDHDALSKKGIRIDSITGGKACIPCNLLSGIEYPNRYAIIIAIRCITNISKVSAYTNDWNPKHYWNGYKEEEE